MISLTELLRRDAYVQIKRRVGSGNMKAKKVSLSEKRKRSEKRNCNERKARYILIYWQRSDTNLNSLIFTTISSVCGGDRV